MARSQGTGVENQFVGGLVTEATGLNFPEKAVTDCWNVRFKETGSVVRRYGYAYENDTTAIANSTGSKGVCKTYLWKGVGQDGAKTFLVIQAGTGLSFYEPDRYGNFGTGIKAFSVNLNQYRTSANDVAKVPAGITSGNGKLFVTHPFCDPIYITYDSESDTITKKRYSIRIRDMEGVDDDLKVGKRPDELSDLHKYNLYNQGWDQGIVPWGSDESGYPIDVWHQMLGVYPSNADVWWYGKGANSSGKEVLAPNVIRMVSKATGFAPRGHYIYNAFAMDREAESGIPGIPGKTSEGLRPSVCAFFAGRVWHAGVTHPDYQGKLYYTQLIERDDQIGACYQQNDPTSEQLSDLLDTDGGEIKVTGMGKVCAMVESGTSLYLFANNGIWSISGSGAEGTGFVATNFSIRKISTIGADAGSSFVDVEGTPVWWNSDGIWTISEQGVESLSNGSIRSFIQQSIPAKNRKFIQGAYNPLLRTIQWLWKSEEATNRVNAYKYDRILEYNLKTKAFYPMKWTLGDEAFASIFCATSVKSTATNEETLLDSTDGAITDSSGTQLTSLVTDEVGDASARFKYVTSENIGSSITGITCTLSWHDGTWLQSPFDTTRGGISFYDASGIQIGTTNWSTYEGIAYAWTSATVWGTRSHTVTIPENAVSAKIHFGLTKPNYSATSAYENNGVIDNITFAVDGVAVSVTNGGFETGDLTGWTTVAGNPMVRSTGDTGFSSSYTAYAGSKFLFGGTQSYSEITQDVSLSASSTPASTIGIAFAEETDTSYYDFVAKLGAGVANFDSYFITGPKIRGEGNKNQILEYITVFANVVANASCRIRGRWDWSNSSSSGKWSTEQEVYTVNRDNRDVSRKRLLIRGSGPALQLQYRSMPGQPFDIIGWSSWESADAVP